MGKQTKTRKSSENVGKGKVTPVQIAFIVDRYLSDNNFHQTRSVFRDEASSLISKSSIQEAPKSLLSLGAMLNEYISLKEQKVMMDQERVRLEHEKSRVQTLLQGMQTVMNAYNASGAIPAPIPTSSTPFSGSIAGCPPYQTPTSIVVPLPSNNMAGPGTHSSAAPKKRKSKGNVQEAPSTSKRTCNNVDSGISPNHGTLLQAQLVPVANGLGSAELGSASGSPSYACAANGLSSQGSGVAKCLFNQTVQCPLTASPGPKTPPQGTSSPSDKSACVVETYSPANGSNNSTTQEITPTHCTVISSQTVTVSPCKQGTIYSVQRNHIITSSPVKTNMKRMNKRDHVKGRLNFDTSDALPCPDQSVVQEVSTSESEKETDIFDIDLPNLDQFGPNFDFTELLVDLDLDSGGLNFSTQPNMGSSPDNGPGSSPESGAYDFEANQVSTEVLPPNDLTVEGSGAMTAVQSVTKSICILSPAKNRNRSPDQSCPQREL